MTRYDFDDWLRYRLSDLPQEEVDRIAAFYMDAIEARMEDGMTEEQAIYDLGEPEGLLEAIRADLPEHVIYKPVHKSTGKRTSRVAALLLAAVISFIVLISLTLLFSFSPVRRSEILYEAVTAPVEVPAIDWADDNGSVQSFDPTSLEKIQIHASLDRVLVEPCDENRLYVSCAGSYEANVRGATLYLENIDGDLLVRMPTAYYLRLSIDSELGDVELYEIIPATLNVSTDVGNIYLHNVAAHEWINLSSDVGYIEGSLKYRQEDYCIDAEAEAGQCNLADSVNDGTPLTVTTDVGSIKIQFEN